MIISFMGIDGSGKTTIARTLESRLEKAGKKVEYHSEFVYLFLKYPLKFFFGNRLKKATNKYLKKEKSRPSYFKVWPYLVFLDCLTAYLKFKFLERNRIIVCDRYFYDFIIAFEGLGDSNLFIRRLFLSLPRPDIGFMLDVSPKIAYKRKKATHDSSIDWFIGWRLNYLKLNKKLKFKVINTEKTIEETLEEIFDHMRDLRVISKE